MLRATAFLTALFLFSCGPAETTEKSGIDQNLVRADVIKHLEANPAVSGTRVRGDGGIEIISDGKTESIVFLDNLFRELSITPEEAHDSIIDRFIRVSLRPLSKEGAAGASSDLRVSVYSADYRSFILAQPTSNGGTDVQPIFQRIAPDLFAAIVVDSAESVFTATPRWAARVGLNVEQAWKTARQNMTPLIAKIRLTDLGGIWKLQIDGYYENAIIAMPDIWDDIETVIGDSVVVATPARGSLFIVRAGDKNAISRLRAVVTTLTSEKPRSISGQLYRRSNAGWLIE